MFVATRWHQMQGASTMHSEAGHREIEHTADLGFEVWAGDLETLYAEATDALIGLYADRDAVASGERREIEIEGGSAEEMLVHWLHEVYLLLELDSWLAAGVETVDIGSQRVRGTLVGESYDPSRHTIHTAIKAITYHDLELRRDASGSWRTRVIVDV